MKPTRILLLLTLISVTPATAEPYRGFEGIDTFDSAAQVKSRFYAGVEVGNGEFSLSEPIAGVRDADYSIVGVFVGRDRQLNNFIAGIEFDAGRIRQKNSDFRHKLLAIKSRVGWSMGRFLPYALVGTAIVYPDDVLTEQSSGAIFGLGGEFAMTEDLALGLEYTKQWHHDLAGQRGLDLTVQQVLLRTTFRF